jgi:GT2 family glycosyltransferase
MNHRQALGYGFTWAGGAMRMQWLRGPRDDLHEVPFACGCLMAFRRDDFEAVGGFDPGLLRWGSEDAEIGINLWRHGRSTVVVPQSHVAHLFRPAGPYEVARHMVVHNSLRVATVHFPPATLAAVFGATRRYHTFAQAYAQLADGDAWTRRDEIAGRARYDGSWFLDRFRMDGLR